MKKTRYRRTRTDRAITELTAEVRALRAEVAVLSAQQVQIVPYPYPQPYPIYPQPYTPPLNPWQPWYPYTPIITYGTITTSNEKAYQNGTLSFSNLLSSTAVGD